LNSRPYSQLVSPPDIEGQKVEDQKLELGAVEEGKGVGARRGGCLAGYSCLQCAGIWIWLVLLVLIGVVLVTGYALLAFVDTIYNLLKDTVSNLKTSIAKP
jgi:hypothetical protein